uniref:hypothetical protein n=1 Tax=Herbidospora sakaeratensis TaxID=564415 RepID=UPI00078657A8|nr:hypothetical protein [Herbidospora sakaeratensis]
MTGLDHYQEAEALLRRADGADLDGHAQYLVARAQVHATLALAAATALRPASVPDVHTAADLVHRDDFPLTVIAAWWKKAGPVVILSAREAGEHFDEIRLHYYDTGIRQFGDVMVPRDFPLRFAPSTP